MNKRGIPVLQTGLLLAAMFAHAASNEMTRIKVLSSESQSTVLDDSGVPKNCDGLNFDAYCHSTMAAVVTNTLLVQEGDGNPFRIACTVDSKWSRCAPLPQDERFDARIEKHGMTVYYQDDGGKPRKQLYTLVATAARTSPEAAAPARSADTAQSSGQGLAADGVPGNARRILNCSFISTPAGAEVSVDGRFIGSTPSVLSLAPGAHEVIVSMPGFARWKRVLSAASGSELTVNAILQKVP